MGLPRCCAALLPRTVRAEKKAEHREKPLAGLRPKGRHSQAARRQRAHPLGSAHAGEGTGDGAIFALAFARLLGAATLRRERSGAKREKGKHRMG